MKKIKLIFGLLFLIGTLFSTGTIQKKLTSNVGWGISRLASSGEGMTVFNEAAWGGIGAYAGFEYGATIGWLGGPAGAVVGGAIGAL